MVVLEATAPDAANSHLEDVCSNCGTEFMEDSMFCRMCGTKRLEKGAKKEPEKPTEEEAESSDDEEVDEAPPPPAEDDSDDEAEVFVQPRCLATVILADERHSTQVKDEQKLESIGIEMLQGKWKHSTGGFFLTVRKHRVKCATGQKYKVSTPSGPPWSHSFQCGWRS